MDVSTNTNHIKDKIIIDLQRRNLTEKELDNLILISNLLLQYQREKKDINIDSVRQVCAKNENGNSCQLENMRK